MLETLRVVAARAMSVLTDLGVETVVAKHVGRG
jgi:hypothetical protein